MSKPVKEWARKARLKLIKELGGVCADCGESNNLTFDCIIPQGHAHHKGSTDQRMCFYLRQHREYANIQVLCGDCNARKGDDVPETDLFNFRKHITVEPLPF